MHIAHLGRTLHSCQNFRLSRPQLRTLLCYNALIGLFRFSSADTSLGMFELEGLRLPNRQLESILIFNLNTVSRQTNILICSLNE